MRTLTFSRSDSRDAFISGFDARRARVSCSRSAHLVAAVVFSLLVFATFLLTTSASTSLFGAAFFDVVEEIEDARQKRA